MSWKRGSRTESGRLPDQPSAPDPDEEFSANRRAPALGATVLFATSLMAALYSIALGMLTYLGLLH